MFKKFDDRKRYYSKKDPSDANKYIDLTKKEVDDMVANRDILIEQRQDDIRGHIVKAQTIKAQHFSKIKIPQVPGDTVVSVTRPHSLKELIGRVYSGDRELQLDMSNVIVRFAAEDLTEKQKAQMFYDVDRDYYYLPVNYRDLIVHYKQ